MWFAWRGWTKAPPTEGPKRGNITTHARLGAAVGPDVEDDAVVVEVRLIGENPGLLAVAAAALDLGLSEAERLEFSPVGE